jgi:DNA-binding LytR/AlgR family response regulator
MKHSYIIVDDSHESILNTQATAMRFQNLAFMGYASNYDDALNLILEQQPRLIFLEINPLKKESNLSLNLINELYRYLTVVPTIIVTSKDQSLVFRAMEYGVADYLVKPLDLNAFRKAIFKFEKSVNQPTFSNPVVTQQTIPQQALTFSDFLRQEPIEKSIEKPTVDKSEEIHEENNISETSVVEPTVEKASTESEDFLSEEIRIEELLETEQNGAIEANSEILEILDEVNTTIEEELIYHEAQSAAEISKQDDTSTRTEEIASTDDILTPTEINLEENSELLKEQENSNEDETITFLPGKKVIIEQEQPLIICVKSYGDYRYIDSGDILYFEADNNSTDIHLKDGEMVTAFKTLKVFENVLPPNQFLRIHNSYIININQVARIHTGNSVCYIKNSTIKLPFSKSYKENVELIIHRIASGNYIEI